MAQKPHSCTLEGHGDDGCGGCGADGGSKAVIEHGCDVGGTDQGDSDVLAPACAQLQAFFFVPRVQGGIVSDRMAWRPSSPVAAGHGPLRRRPVRG